MRDTGAMAGVFDIDLDQPDEYASDDELLDEEVSRLNARMLLAFSKRAVP